MPKRTLIVVAVAWIAALVPVPAAPPPQEAPPAPEKPKLGPGDQLCGICQTTGRVAFEQKKELLALEAGVTFCSEVVANEEVNHGLDFKACPRCQAPSLAAKVEAEHAGKVQAGLDWLKGRREIDQFINDPKGLRMMHCSTPHFELDWSVPKVKVGKQTIDEHAAMHLYARYLEEDYQRYLDLFGFKHETDQMNVRHTVMIFDQAKHASKAQPKYCGMGGTGITDGVKLMGYKSFFVCWWNRAKNPDNDDFHEYLLHNMQHLFLCSYYNCFWLARKNGWIDEGLSHYMTDVRFKQCRTHCFQEQDEAHQWVGAPWRPEMKKRVAANRIPEFTELAVKHGESLNAEEHLFVWSMVEYLIDAQDKAKFVQLVRGLKEQTPLRNLLKDLYGVSPFQLVENWKQYVLDTYPSR